MAVLIKKKVVAPTMGISKLKPKEMMDFVGLSPSKSLGQTLPKEPFKTSETPPTTWPNLLKASPQKVVAPTPPPVLRGDDPDVFPLGAKVVAVGPGIGAWYPLWQPGDTGVILKHYHAGGCHDAPIKDDLYKVLLTTSRDKGHPEVHIHRSALAGA